MSVQLRRRHFLCSKTISGFLSKQNSKTVSLLKVTKFELNHKHFPKLFNTTLYSSRTELLFTDPCDLIRKLQLAFIYDYEEWSHNYY